MMYKRSIALVSTLAIGVLGQTVIVSDCSTVSGQQVCQGPSGVPVTFASGSTASTTAADSSATTSAPASTSVEANPTTAADMSVTAITDCHYHGQTPYCFAGASEFEILTTYASTQALPTAYTDCHSHGEEMFCVGPDDSEVQVRAEAATSGTESEGHDDHDHDESPSGSASASATGDSGALDCHFHAGVEHCVPVGGSESESATVNAEGVVVSAARTCDRTPREYNVPLRIGMLFVVLFTSCLSVFTPILLGSLLRNRIVSFVLLQLKQFGTGVLVSTAFVHLYTHAELLLTNPCIVWPERYESTTAAFVMLGIFLAFIVEYIGSRIILRRVGSQSPTATPPPEVSEKSTAHESITAGHFHGSLATMHPQQQKLAVMVMEAGIVFHSILIGLTLIVAGDSVFGSLVVVIIFHQMFEGIALGSRIAELPSTSTHGVAPVTRTAKLLFAGVFALITPIGMAIGIAVLDSFNGSDSSTLLAIGILDAISAGILAWVALVEMWAGDWLHGPLARAPVVTAGVSGGSLVVGMLIMSVLGKWA